MLGLQRFQVFFMLFELIVSRADVGNYHVRHAIILKVCAFVTIKVEGLLSHKIKIKLKLYGLHHIRIFFQFPAIVLVCIFTLSCELSTKVEILKAIQNHNQKNPDAHNFVGD